MRSGDYLQLVCQSILFYETIRAYTHRFNTDWS